MPRYHLPNGKVVFTDHSLSDKELGDLIASYNEPEEKPSEGVFAPVNNFILKRLHQLSGEEPGILNPNPDLNPVINKPILPEAEHNKDEGYLPWAAKGIYNTVIRPISSPLGALGTMMGSSPAEYEPIKLPEVTEPIGLPKSEPLGLPPSPTNFNYAGGPSGGSGQVVAAEEAAANPSKYYKVIGKGQTPDAAKGADLAAIKEAERIANLKYGAPEQHPGQYLKVPDKGMQLPLESGDTTGGFNPETSGDLEYPLNVVPNQLRPRFAQTNVLGKVPEGYDLSASPNEEISHEFVSGGPEVTDFEEPDTNKSGEYYPVEQKPAQLPSATKLPRDIPEELHNANQVAHPSGDAPPIDTVLKQATPESLPTPGAPKDINNPIAYAGSADQVLESREATKPIVQLIRNKGWDKMLEYQGTTIRKLDDITQGLGNDQLEAFGRTAEGVNTPADDALMSQIPDAADRLKNYRTLMDDIFAGAKVARSGKLNYIEDYVTHAKKMPEDFAAGVKDIFNYRQGKAALKALFERKPLEGPVTNEAAGIYGKGTGEVSESPFVKTRTDTLKDLDYNVNKIGRMYIDSMARETFLRPAVEQAQSIIEKLPNNSKLKELAEWYVKNITRFDAAPQLHQANQKFARFMIDTTGKSMMGFNPHLQALHAMRIGPVWADLGTKYSAQGLAQLIANPRAAYQETASLGLLPQELYPPRFQTPNERANSILNFKSMVDFIDRSIAYKGFKAKYLAEGMAPDMAHEQAIASAKKSTFTTDPARATMGLNPDYSALGTVGRLMAQYKSVPAKVVEWTVRNAADFKRNPARAARMGVLLGTAGASAAAGGPELFHAPTSLENWSAASLTEVKKILTSIYKGNPEDALSELALWMTPAGKSIQRLTQ